jgi:hypothetical protein
LKEYKRRQLIQSTHNNLSEKKGGLDINFVLSVFKEMRAGSKKPFQRAINNFNLMQNVKKKDHGQPNMRSKSTDINDEDNIDEKEFMSKGEERKRNKSSNRVTNNDSNNIHQIKKQKYYQVIRP